MELVDEPNGNIKGIEFEKKCLSIVEEMLSKSIENPFYRYRLMLPGRRGEFDTVVPTTKGFIVLEYKARSFMNYRAHSKSINSHSRLYFERDLNRFGEQSDKFESIIIKKSFKATRPVQRIDRVVVLDSSYRILPDVPLLDFYTSELFFGWEVVICPKCHLQMVLTELFKFHHPVGPEHFHSKLVADWDYSISQKVGV